MLKSNVSYSTDKDSYEAGRACAEKAVVDLIETKVAFLFSSVKYDQYKLLDGAKSVLGTAPIIGCTSSGAIIVPDGVISSENGFAGMLAIGDNETAVGVAASEREKSPRETGRKVALDAMAKVGTDRSPAYFYMVASPAEEEEYAKGIADVIGNVPFFGGSAADDAAKEDWKIFTNDKCFTDGVAVAFFYTNKPMVNKYTGAYHETINSGVITKIKDKRQLVEIDGKLAINVYAKWTDKKVKELMGEKILTSATTSPLGVKDRLGNLIAIRQPMSTNEDFSINIGNNIAVNTAVIQMEASVDELIESTGKTLKQVRTNLTTEAGAYLLVHNASRKIAIGDRIEEVAKQLKREANGVPFLTVFTSGEYGSEDHGENTCGGLMLSFTGFAKNI